MSHVLVATVHTPAVDTKRKNRFIGVGSFLSLAIAACFGFGGYKYKNKNKEVFTLPKVKEWLLCMGIGFVLLSFLVTMFCYYKTDDDDINKKKRCCAIFFICILFSVTILSLLMVLRRQEMIDGIFDTNHMSTLIISLGIVAFLLACSLCVFVWKKLDKKYAPLVSA